jgi:hypothetical protein
MHTRSRSKRSGDGDDAGLVFRYRWEPIRPDLRLFNRRDPVLDRLAQPLANGP